MIHMVMDGMVILGLQHRLQAALAMDHLHLTLDFQKVNLLAWLKIPMILFVTLVHMHMKPAGH